MRRSTCVWLEAVCHQSRQQQEQFEQITVITVSFIIQISIVQICIAPGLEIHVFIRAAFIFIWTSVNSEFILTYTSEPAVFHVHSISAVLLLLLLLLLINWN